MADIVKGKVSLLLRLPDAGVLEPPDSQTGHRSAKAPERIIEEILVQGASEENYTIVREGRKIYLTYGG